MFRRLSTTALAVTCKMKTKFMKAKLFSFSNFNPVAVSEVMVRREGWNRS